MNKIKTAVIGVGNMGKNHARVYSEISDLVAISDISAKLAKPIAKQFGVQFYSDYIQMLEKEKPEAVSVVVPSHIHKDIAIECLKRKIPTLVEKPIADNLEDAKNILSVARNNKTLLMVGHIERYNPAINKLKQLVESGKLGKIINLLAVRVGISPPKVKNSDVVLDLAIHDLDIFNYLLNEYNPQKKIIRHRIFNYNISDSASLLLKYKKTTGMIQTNWITPIKIRKLYVTGLKGFAEVDYISQKLTLYGKILNEKSSDGFPHVVSLSEVPKEKIYVAKKEPLKMELATFLNNIKQNVQVDSKFAVEALKTLL